MSYFVYFVVDDREYRLPVNPKEISITSNQEVKEVDILKLGKVAIPGGLKLKEISFEAELPGKAHSYVVNKDKFIEGRGMIKLLNEWRENKKPIRFLAGRNYSDELSEDDKNQSLRVTIAGLSYKESAGEEGDFYVTFKLKEYREWKTGIKDIKIDTRNVTGEVLREGKPPKPKENVYIIKSGDTLWAIAKRFLGDGSRYPEIHRNNIKVLGGNPNLIYPGQKIIIPGGD